MLQVVRRSHSARCAVMMIGYDSIRVIKPFGYRTLTRRDIVRFQLSKQTGNSSALQIVCRAREPINVTMKRRSGDRADRLPAMDAWLDVG